VTSEWLLTFAAFVYALIAIGLATWQKDPRTTRRGLAARTDSRSRRTGPADVDTTARGDGNLETQSRDTRAGRDWLQPQ
jgi:hypothetical protein